MLTVGTDSYVTLAEAELLVTDYHASADPKRVLWTALSNADKEAYLRQGLASLEELVLVGTKISSTQTLQFPRNISEYEVISMDVPTAVKRAQVELALQALQGVPERVQLQRQGVSSASVGHASESYTGARTLMESPESYSLMKPYLAGGLRIV